MNKIPNKSELEYYYSLGYSMKEIGNILNMATGKIHKYFHIYNIKTRNFGSNNEFAKIKISIANTGKTHSYIPNEETKKKISEAKKRKE